MTDVESRRTHTSAPTAVGLAVALFAVWTLATFLLEGRLLTFQRPEATRDRLIYTVVANVFIGILVSSYLIRILLQRTHIPVTITYGLAKPPRIVVSMIAGLSLGCVFLALQGLATWHPVVLANAFLQVVVVSIAEALVCWAVLGSVVRNVVGEGTRGIGVAIVVAALAFGLYHFGHSPPFNTFQMVGFLSLLGVLTGGYFFVARDLYGTILFHNALAVKGVTDALTEAGRVEFYERLQVPLWITGIAAALILVLADVFLMRPSLKQRP